MEEKGEDEDEGGEGGGGGGKGIQLREQLMRVS